MHAVHVLSQPSHTNAIIHSQLNNLDRKVPHGFLLHEAYFVNCRPKIILAIYSMVSTATSVYLKNRITALGDVWWRST